MNKSDIKLADRNQCTLCSACYNACNKQAISLIEDKEGFSYPQINTDKCVGCGLCMKSCPELNNEALERFTAQDTILAGWSKDDEIRTNSSSGGIFSAVAYWIINHGGVVFGAAYDEEMNVKHIAVHTLEELAQLRGSKYTQSVIGDTYKQAKTILKEGNLVLFTGVPCQIAGLYSFLGNKKPDNLYTIDIICHGTPSQKVLHYYWEKLKERLNIPRIDSFSFRDTKNWSCSCSCSCSCIEYPITDKNNLYMKLFLSSYLHKESCYQCRYANLNRVSDMTIGDFWGIGKYGVPFNHDIKHGVSAILVNSPRGEKLITELNTELFIEERKLAEALKLNYQLTTPSHRPKQRNDSYEFIFTHSYEQIENKYFGSPLYRKTRHLVGNVLRFLKIYG